MTYGVESSDIQQDVSAKQWTSKVESCFHLNVRNVTLWNIEEWTEWMQVIAEIVLDQSKLQAVILTLRVTADPSTRIV